MWDVPKLYISACSNSVQLVPLHPIIISILFHHYKELLDCNGKVGELNYKVDGNKGKCSAIEEETEKTEEMPIIMTLDGFFFTETGEP